MSETQLTPFSLMQSQVYATVASGIEAVEAGHAAIIRYQLYQVMHVSAKICVLCFFFTLLLQLAQNKSLNSMLIQIAGDNTGLTLNDNSPITFATAVTAINKLRDALGGTASSSVENALTRTPTLVSGVNIASPGPDLFSADANSIAFTRIPVSCVSASFEVISTLMKELPDLAEQHQLTDSCIFCRLKF